MEKKDKISSLNKFLTQKYINTDSEIVKYSGLGVQLSATILVFLFIGIWLDSKLDTKFIFTLIMTFLGFFGGFYNFYLTIKAITDKKKNNQEDKKIE